MTQHPETTKNGKTSEGAAKTVDVLPRAVDLSDEVLDSVKTGQQAAIAAIRKFVDTVDKALPEAVHPLRETLVDGALELADELVTTQYQFLRSVVRSADRTLNKLHDSEG
ncbi:hypothetical protein Y900_005005 [Mycolicibacterium aromaticivorans JS19b1 = JCM 16368]|uniref:PE domain-containing protein n=1 Tax=Mycolicibacterium aromaticivorans JS19b1 = JCM 16368 TaxID=1440774 RepID=A0A064CHT9_9MYCO|nr:hypothetical protein [Mycolicibacterium aromaticivorans]KDE98317.1 hypothetical protein Y900_005005 [Mycolicibacterium aromaticivorans JS19b1 = JCM 16368]